MTTQPLWVATGPMKCATTRRNTIKILAVIQLGDGLSWIFFFFGSICTITIYWFNHISKTLVKKNVYIAVIMKRIVDWVIISVLECTHDNHCTSCAIGQTGKCHHDHHRFYCQCEGKSSESANYDIDIIDKW